MKLDQTTVPGDCSLSGWLGTGRQPLVSADNHFVIDFVLLDSMLSDPTNSTGVFAKRSSGGLLTAKSRTVVDSSHSVPVSDRLLLSQFIGDQSNASVAWLWQSVVDGQCDFWPLTLFGPSGVGKTQLAAVFAAATLSHFRLSHFRLTPFNSSSNGHAETGQRHSVLNLQSKDFARAFRSAEEINSVADWRMKMETASVLLLDDIHYLISHVDAQHELAEILDQRQLWSLPTILVCQQRPSLSGFTGRLASRLNGGFSCGISSPGLVAVAVIIKQLFVKQNISISDAEVKNLIDLKLTNLAAINQVVWRWKLEFGVADFNWDNASSQLKSLAISNPSVVKPEIILKATTKLLGLTLKDLKGLSRRSAIVRARGIAMWLCRKHLNLSFQKIGNYFGNRDHTTVMNSCQRIDSTMDQDSLIKTSIDRIQLQLGLT